MNNVVPNPEDNSPGIYKIGFVPVVDVLSIPKAQANGYIIDPVLLRDGAMWNEIHVTVDANNFDLNNGKSAEGNTNATAVTGFVAGDAPWLVTTLQTMADYEDYIIVVTDANDMKRLVGSIEYPAKFDFKVGYNGRRGYTLNFKCVSPQPPYYYQSPVVAYPDEIVVDPTFMNLDAYIAQYMATFDATKVNRAGDGEITGLLVYKTALDINVADEKTLVHKKYVDELVANIDLSNYYTKSETYSAIEVNDLIDAIDIDNYYNKSQTYNQTEIDDLIAGIDLSNYYTKSETYSAIEVNDLINAIDIDNYYNKSQTYNQTEIDALIAGIDLSSFITLTSLSGTSGVSYNNSIGAISLNLATANAWSAKQSATAFKASGTAGAGYFEMVNQSTAPTAVAGSTIMYSDSATRLSFTRMNASLGSAITRTLIFPDANADYTFPTAASGTSNTLAGLGTAQTWTAQQIFVGTHQIGIIQVYAGSAYVDALKYNVDGSLEVGYGFNQIRSKGCLPDVGGIRNLGTQQSCWGNTYISNLIGATSTLTISTPNAVALSSNIINVTTGNQSSNTALLKSGQIYIATGNITNVGALSSQASSSILFDVGTVTGSAIRGGVVFFNSNTEPAWNSMQRGLFFGNATAAPNADPTAGIYRWTESGKARIREVGMGANHYIVSSAGGGKITAAAPYTNDGYYPMYINGTTIKFMTTA